MSLRDRINSRVSKIRRKGYFPERRILYFHSQIDDILDWAITNCSQLRNLLSALPGMGDAKHCSVQRLKEKELLMDLRKAVKEEKNPPCLYLTDFHIYEPNAKYTEMIERFLSSFPESVLLISSNDVLIPRGFEDRVELIEAIQIDQEDVAELILNELKNEDFLCSLTARDERIKALAQRFKGLSLRQIEDVLNLVSAECGVVCELSPACLKNEKLRQATHEATNRYIRQIKLSISEKDGSLFYIDVTNATAAVGMDAYEPWLKQRVEGFQKGYPNALRAITFVGVPGSGKTLTAIRTAQLLECDLVRFNLSMVKTRAFGGTEKNLRSKLSLFEAQSPLVVLIDEAEKDLPKSGNSQTHEVTASLLGTLLSWMNDRKAPVLLFFTSNDITSINEELFRPGRVDRIFFVGMPSRDELAAILQSNLISRQKAWKEHHLEFLPAKLIETLEDCQNKGIAHECCTKIVDDLAELITETDRNLFFTGADLSQLINDAISRLTDTEQNAEPKQMPFTPEDLGAAMCALAKEAPVSTGERSLSSVAQLYLQCARKNYAPASKHDALIKVAETRELPEKTFEHKYDRLLYQRIGSQIIEFAKINRN